jgi:hypothetical protein
LDLNVFYIHNLLSMNLSYSLPDKKILVITLNIQ